jgi:hypothetical protein
MVAVQEPDYYGPPLYIHTFFFSLFKLGCQYPDCIALETGWLMYMEQLMEWELAGETEVLRRKPARVPFRPQQIPHDLTWYWTRAAELRHDLLLVVDVFRYV